MRYLSVCSGIEAATVAWHDLGWKPEAFSEIEKFPSQVLQHHYPDVPNLGDMTNFKEWNLNGTIDILVGGTPCQSFSVAGLRKGLEDPRGNLMLTYLAIADRFKPKWIVWENVPGILSSNGGRDFGAFLGALVELGYGFAYRVLDAQNFGVAQRRRRVFVVGCLGDWRSAAEVLFEPESLRGDTKKSRKKREETSRCLTTGIGTRLDGETDQFVVQTYQGNQETTIAATLQTTCHEYSRADGFNTAVYENHPADSRVTELGETCSTVAARLRAEMGDNQVAVATGVCGVEQKVVYAFDSLASNSMKSSNPHSGCREVDLAKTIDTTVPCPSKNQGGIGILQSQFVDVYNQAIDGQVSATMTSVCGGASSSGPKIMQNMAVRRLTPVECERLQGFPDGYTDIQLNGKQTPDGGRYKALGNSMAVPVMAWIGKRIQEVECGY
jgi:DNA (cytosine-5)-methyltransferase 1